LARRWALALAALLLGGVLRGASAEDGVASQASPPEPPAYRLDDYQAPTPATLTGARVVSTVEAHRLWETKGAIFIDAMPRPPKPKNLPAGTLWHDTPRFDIPASNWLVDVGYGALSDERDLYFRDHLKSLTGEDPGKPLLFYCKANCWMSWNAAKRAMAYGYTNVIWYPEGTEGWQKAGFDLVEAQPLP
jgi:PQQ-dependent catabolism-associated CXXCW motif protein